MEIEIEILVDRDRDSTIEIEIDGGGQIRIPPFSIQKSVVLFSSRKVGQRRSATSSPSL